jgi:hypothetical protein
MNLAELFNDEKKRLIEHLNNSLKICSGNDCEDCIGNDYRATVDSLEIIYGLGSSAARRIARRIKVCAIASSMAFRIDMFASKNGFDDIKYITDQIKTLSLNPNQKQIKNAMKYLRSFLQENG